MELYLINLTKLKNFKFTNNEFKLKEGDEITFTVGGFQYTMKINTVGNGIDFLRSELKKTKTRKLRTVF